VLTLISRIFLVLSRILYRAGLFLDRHVDRAHVKRSARLHDMVSHPDEPFYAGQYLHWIMPVLDALYPGGDILLLDLACGQGRLTLPLAEWNRKGNVICVDFTEEAVRKAEEYSRMKRLNNVTFRVSDMLEYLKDIDSGTVDVVTCIEVLYMVGKQDEVIEEIFRVLKPGGVAFLGFRSRYYNLVDCIRRRMFESAKMVLETEEGKIMGSPVWFSWYTRARIEERLREKGFREIRCRGIGPCSGIEGDPLADIARPSLLGAREQTALFAIEIEAADAYADCSRYILAIAAK